MAIIVCTTRAQVNAIVGTKQIWHDVPNARWVVRTGADIETPSPDSSTLTRVQFFNGALIVGGQNLLNSIEAYIADRIANGTPVQRIYWRDSNEFVRYHQFINQLRVAIIVAILSI